MKNKLFIFKVMYNLVNIKFDGEIMRVLYILIISTFLFSSTYDIGDIVSNEHQSIEKNTCYAGNGYEINDLWTLGDWNGAFNGGDYNVIFIDMSASW